MSRSDASDRPDSSSQRSLLEALLRSALGAAHAGDAVRAALRSNESGRLEVAGKPVETGSGLVVFAAGKAACAMAAAAEEIVGDRIRTGLVVTKQGHTGGGSSLPLREAGHPVPDARSEAAAREALALVAGIGADELLLVLLSGGASALLSCPQPGLSQADLVATTRQLLACGADIRELNCVRKQISAVAGGRLARAAGCRRIELLAVSDVPGDELAVIGSGPCALDEARPADALAVIERHGLRASLPAPVIAHLERAPGGVAALDEGPELPQVRSTIVARSFDAANAAALAAAERGIRGIWLGPVLHGEARERGRELARMALDLQVERPTCLIASGETTVTLRGDGRGGRSQELALAAALELDGHDQVCLLAAGTDGTDGPTDAAGAYADGASVARGRAHGRVASADLARNDSFGFFSLEGGLLRTGPTDTNVMDLVLIGVGLAGEMGVEIA